MADADLETGQVEAAYSANVLGNALEGAFALGQDLLWEVGINRIPVVNVENACTSGSTALHLACLAIAAGAAEIVAVVGVERMSTRKGAIPAGALTPEGAVGFLTPAVFAVRARAYLETFGGRAEDLALVAVKNLKNASLNPNAVVQTAVTYEEVLGSPMVADPLTRLQCCPMCDGAAALILGSPAAARRLSSNPVWITASVLASGSYPSILDQARWEMDVRAARRAYELAGIGPADLDLAEVHDAFTISEVLHYEGLGFCGEGEGLSWLLEGHPFPGGGLPVNPSGGLLGRGHPLAATGVAQVVELNRQLRGRAGLGQVPGAKTALAHCMGGDKQADGKSITVMILQG